MDRPLKNHIREIITKAVNLRERWVQLGYGSRDLQIRESLSKIKAHLSFYENKDKRAHIRLVNVLKYDLYRIMPNTTSKFNTLRTEVMNLIDLCERYNHPITT